VLPDMTTLTKSFFLPSSLIFFLLLFIYSYVRTLFGSFLPPALISLIGILKQLAMPSLLGLPGARAFSPKLWQHVHQPGNSPSCIVFQSFNGGFIKQAQMIKSRVIGEWIQSLALPFPEAGSEAGSLTLIMGVVLWWVAHTLKLSRASWLLSHLIDIQKMLPPLSKCWGV
jgi:hypothetical protein